MKLGDVPPGWGKLIAVLVTALAGLVPLFLVVRDSGKSSPPSRIEIIHEVTSGVAVDVRNERIRAQQRAACAQALRATPIAILRKVPPETLRDTVVSCSAPFRPPRFRDPEPQG